MRARTAAEVAAEVRQAAQAGVSARRQAEEALSQHMARLAALEDAAVAAERAAASPRTEYRPAS
jgi:hypothetical protein